jgi:molybdate transport system substrate-binding protein
VKRLVTAGLLAAALAMPASAGTTRLTIYAASSLAEVFPKIDARARYSFAGSDDLAFQIRQGGPADVFASASPKYTQDLYRRGLVDRPRTFARNRLTLIVPRSNPAGIRNVFDLRRPGIRLVLAASSVPIGKYARQVLARLGLNAALRHVVSDERDVKGVVGKVLLGEADAGFVYATDVKPVLRKVGVIRIRESAQPHVVYEVAVVKNAPHLAAAYAFVTRLIRPAAQRELVRSGFGRKPAG